VEGNTASGLKVLLDCETFLGGRGTVRLRGALSARVRWRRCFVGTNWIGECSARLAWLGANLR
jgi:hypothetical protein